MSNAGGRQERILQNELRDSPDVCDRSSARGDSVLKPKCPQVLPVLIK